MRQSASDHPSVMKSKASIAFVANAKAQGWVVDSYGRLCNVDVKEDVKTPIRMTISGESIVLQQKRALTVEEKILDPHRTMCWVEIGKGNVNSSSVEENRALLA
jgi:hypothetical protein